MRINKWKRNTVLIIAMFSIVVSMLNPALIAFADSKLEKAEENFNKESSEFLEDAENARDVLDILDKDSDKNPNPKRESISFVMKRLFYPGVYVNDVRDGVLSNSIKEDKKKIVYDGSVCNPKAPNNLLNHNCNIPNFTTGLIQNIAEPWMSPFSNAEKSSSYSVFGLGVPKDIPGGKVPVNPASRKHAYTALELFGYDLKLIAYTGEWDQITVSNSARMLSNFGVIDKITLTGTTLWNGAKKGVSTFIEDFSWDPRRWFGTAKKSYEAAASSGINTVVDTSELNIVATNAWKRPNIDRTLYNIYVMSDKEILAETSRNYFEIFNSGLVSKANKNTELNKVISLNPEKSLDGIGFVFDPEMETEESKKARKKAEEQREKDKKHNAQEKYNASLLNEYGETYYEPNIIELTKIPKKVFYTEKEQMGIWEKDPKVAKALASAREEGLLKKDSAADYSDYSKLEKEWQENYSPYFESKFTAMGETVQEILEENDTDIFQEHPYLDPKQGISKYACANSDGSIMRDKDGAVEYLYKANNSGSKEYLNSLCKKPRPPIGGGLLGTGWENGIDDTRHIDNVSGESLIASKVNNVFTSFIRSINSFIAKVTNVILGMSFSPLMDELGIDTIVSKLIENFRDTIFFPLAGLTAAIGGVMLFFQLLRNGSAWQLLISIFMTFLIFIIGTAFLLHPTATISLVDEFPSKMDKVISDTILGGGEDTTYCSTGKDKDGVRSAQCSVWGAMVFEPWVHLQFGTGYDNLYAKGKAPAGSGEMENKNGSLVGDAAVNMGNGEVVNNWAMYQLSKTKAGTINSRDKEAKFGVIDKDLYRLVDLQAGPNNGALSDSRYFESWTGERGGGILILLTLIQAILMAFAIGGLGIAKIEVSFMFSISMLFLPFMLLYALLPKGREKLKGYVANLISLLLKRIIIVLMISVLLKVIVVGYSKSDSLISGALVAIFVSTAFIIYKKELLNMITATEQNLLGGDTQQVKEAFGKIVPKVAKQQYSMLKANVRGGAAGFIGGAAGAMEHKAELRARKLGVLTSLKSLEMRERMNWRNGLNENQLEKKMELEIERDNTDSALSRMKKLTADKLKELEDENNNYHEELMMEKVKMTEIYENAQANGNEKSKEVEELMSKSEKRVASIERKIQRNDIKIAGGERKASGPMQQGTRGLIDSMNIIGRTAERRIRAEGYAPLSAYKDIKETVYSRGAKEIADGEDLEAYDMYKEQLSHSSQNKSKTESSVSSSEQGQLMNPKIQRRVRKMAKDRAETANSETFTSAISSDRDIEELSKVAELIDKKRKVNRVVNPRKAAVQREEEEKRIEESTRKTSSVETIIGRIEKDVAEGVNPDRTEKRYTNDEEIEVDIYEERERSIHEQRKEKTRKEHKKNEEMRAAEKALDERIMKFMREEEELENEDE